MSQAIIFDTSVEQFETEVIAASHQTPVLVDFWADWCPPCVVLTPILDKVANSLGGKILLAKVEVDEGDNMRLAGRFGLRGFPTVILFAKGEEVGRFSSARPEGWVREFISQHAGI
jgi:putative thioredoxin